ncbi:hypothetical protein PMIN01_04226 [Paraphaeosphaeria minitans]|uniref:Uncharacterized protein n=1 Tax=Paraphaeosphaeria minitans TaxID=565426 RepID=A0A9P6KRP5_9PLEO|nr:hypothetical protein PMIN01_04226 [Paraphaeosphaeria minitans]
MSHFHNIMRTLLDRKVPFKTERGHLGIASQALQQEDRIVYFRGVNLPMLVLQVASNWQLVAPAYIQDGMLEPAAGPDLGMFLSRFGTTRNKVLRFDSHHGSPVLMRSFSVMGTSIVDVGLFDEAWDWRVDFDQWRESGMSFVQDVPGVSDDFKYDDVRTNASLTG